MKDQKKRSASEDSRDSLSLALGFNRQNFVGQCLVSLFWGESGLNKDQLQFEIDNKWSQGYSSIKPLSRPKFEKMVRSWHTKHKSLFNEWKSLDTRTRSDSPFFGEIQSKKESPFLRFFSMLLQFLKKAFESREAKIERRYKRSLSQCINAKGLLVTANVTSKASEHPKAYSV